MIYGYNFNNDHLVSFSAATPGTLLSDIQLTGLRVGESLVGIDFRPATGQLYAVGSDLSTDRVVSINPTTGVVTSVGGTTPSTPDIFFGTDFNPVVDRLRVVGDADTNRRLNPNDGTLAGTDTTLAYAAGDPGFGRNPAVVHIAYDRNNAGGTLTTLFGIDSGTQGGVRTASSSLVRIGGVDGTPSPNGGQLFTVGALGPNVTNFGGFDIQGGSNTAYAVLRLSGVSTLFTVNLTTGAVTAVGPVSGTPAIDGIAVSPCTVPPPSCDQNFDNVTAPALPSGFSSTSSGSLPPWVTSTTNPDTAPNDAFADTTNGTSVGNTELITSNFVVLPAGSQVTFRNLYNLSNGFDGEVLEISINGGPYQDIITAGGTFVTGGYNGTIAAGTGSPIAGRQAFTGLSGGTQAAPTYITTTVNLPATANGQLIRLKFRVATDNAGTAPGASGVRIDTITGISCSATAAGVQVSGRVLTPDGRGLRNARVTMTDQSGNVRTVTTSSFGFYQFEDVETGQTYIVGVVSRTYRFQQRALQVFDTLTDEDFVGLE